MKFHDNCGYKSPLLVVCSTVRFEDEVGGFWKCIIFLSFYRTSYCLNYQLLCPCWNSPYLQVKQRNSWNMFLHGFYLFKTFFQFILVFCLLSKINRNGPKSPDMKFLEAIRRGRRVLRKECLSSEAWRTSCCITSQPRRNWPSLQLQNFPIRSHLNSQLPSTIILTLVLSCIRDSTSNFVLGESCPRSNLESPPSGEPGFSLPF